MHDVFISYSSIDQKIADAICAYLEARDVRCWYAPRDIRPGEDWAGSIVRAIKNSKVFVLVFSKNAGHSEQVYREITNALVNGCTVVPVRTDLAEMTENMEYYLRSLHWLDATSAPLEEKLEELYDLVAAILQGKKASDVPKVSVKEVKKGGNSIEASRPSRKVKENDPVSCELQSGVSYWVLFTGILGLIEVAVALVILGIYAIAWLQGGEPAFMEKLRELSLFVKYPVIEKAILPVCVFFVLGVIVSIQDLLMFRSIIPENATITGEQINCGYEVVNRLIMEVDGADIISSAPQFLALLPKKVASFVRLFITPITPSECLGALTRDYAHIRYYRGLEVASEDGNSIEYVRWRPIRCNKLSFFYLHRYSFRKQSIRKMVLQGAELLCNYRGNLYFLCGDYVVLLCFVPFIAMLDMVYIYKEEYLPEEIRKIVDWKK